MLTPSFISKELLGSVELTTTDLEKEILNLGLNIKSHGVIDKETYKLNLLVQNERDFLLNKIREFLIDKPLYEKVEIFWSNLNKYSIISSNFDHHLYSDVYVAYENKFKAGFF